MPLINVLTVGISTFISWIKTISESFKARKKPLYFSSFYICAIEITCSVQYVEDKMAWLKHIYFVLFTNNLQCVYILLTKNNFTVLSITILITNC